MTFGAIIASEGNVLESDYSDRLMEVRVEQELSEPTVFALRFQDDVCTKAPDVLSAKSLEVGREITVAAPSGDGLVCLVRGRIEHQQASLGLGGPGAWVEVRGRDRRCELDRTTEARPHDGRASGVIEQMLGRVFSDVDVQSTDRAYSERGGTLNQFGTDLDFIQRQARLTDMCFWVDYPECRRVGDSLEIRERAHFKFSPERPTDPNSPTGFGTVADIQLQADTNWILMLTPNGEQCHTISRFQLGMDTDRPTETRDQFLDEESIEQQPTSSADPQTAIEPGGETLSSVVDEPRVTRTVCAGGEAEVRRRSFATLSEAGWFVQASASTTLQMLRGILEPHKIVTVANMGIRHSGAYQVKSVTHVINGNGHYMDLQLRRNALGRKKG